jgi:methionine sulfoxide reductase heme-binding subunit
LTDPVPHLFWITSRAAGAAALVLSSVAVCIGLIMSGRRLRGRGPDLRAAHEAISLATIVAIVVHAVSLLGDNYLHPSVADISVPFASTYNTLWTATGIVAAWATAALGLSYYARRWIGQRRWRRLHSLTAVAWLLGLLHSLGEGTDAGRLWFLAMVGIVVVPAAALLLARATQDRSGPAQQTDHERHRGDAHEPAHEAKALTIG